MIKTIENYLVIVCRDVINYIIVKKLSNQPGITPFTGILFSSLQVRKIFLPLLGFLPYAPIKNDHHSDRHIKCSNCGTECDVMICLNELYITCIDGYRSLALDVRPSIDPRWP